MFGDKNILFLVRHQCNEDETLIEKEEYEACIKLKIQTIYLLLTKTIFRYNKRQKINYLH